MRSFDKLYSDWKEDCEKHRDERFCERLGQFFINRYYSGNWPELFYERDEKRAAQMIKKFLTDVQWIDELPAMITIITYEV